MANEKKAVLRARRLPWGRLGAGGALDSAAAAPAPSGRGFGVFMANIASQEKRIRRAERERLENRRRTSQVKTWFRRLEEAVESGDATRAEEEHRALVSRIDKAVKSGALHRGNGARKKAAAARLRARL
ncbi:MAG TPA: 30S ribosomal protein S20 [Thermoleophilaceae bacterium]